MSNGLGGLFMRLREQAGTWRKIFFIVLIGLVVVNFFIYPYHPHVGQEIVPGFWAAFGLGVGLVMIMLIKSFLAHIIGVDEDYYERNDE
ncbi:MAG: hypothetical protein ACOCWT_04645 [Desulfohalobiaceae bacterium]